MVLFSQHGLISIANLGEDKDMMEQASNMQGRLQATRESDWDSLLERVSNFCNSHDIEVLKMDAMFLVR
uniref:Uncharacterized protein n=1 Tax=Cucumis melo TaxID=3656 RepID=A0A9I9EJW4_CUCME